MHGMIEKPIEILFMMLEAPEVEEASMIGLVIIGLMLDVGGVEFAIIELAAGELVAFAFWRLRNAFNLSLQTSCST